MTFLSPHSPQLIKAAELVGLTPSEWMRICADKTAIEPLTQVEWREAMLSTVED